MKHNKTDTGIFYSLAKPRPLWSWRFPKQTTAHNKYLHFYNTSQVCKKLDQTSAVDTLHHAGCAKCTRKTCRQLAKKRTTLKEVFPTVSSCKSQLPTQKSLGKSASSPLSRMWLSSRESPSTSISVNGVLDGVLPHLCATPTTTPTTLQPATAVVS